jgi:hypothetical protein
MPLHFSKTLHHEQAAANKLFLHKKKIIGFIESHQQGKGFMGLLIFFARQCDNHQLISIADFFFCFET